MGPASNLLEISIAQGATAHFFSYVTYWLRHNEAMTRPEGRERPQGRQEFFQRAIASRSRKNE